jgi:DNA-binding NarL/FixJ family response regulator
MAEGRTNGRIAPRLWLTEKAVETHVRTILMQLGLPAGEDDNRRVLAVLAASPPRAVTSRAPSL